MKNESFSINITKKDILDNLKFEKNVDKAIGLATKEFLKTIDFGKLLSDTIREEAAIQIRNANLLKIITNEVSIIIRAWIPYSLDALRMFNNVSHPNEPEEKSEYGKLSPRAIKTLESGGEITWWDGKKKRILSMRKEE